MTTVPTTTLSETDLEVISRFHGHLCPMVLLGARCAKKARAAVPGTAGSDALFGYYRGYGCAVDGIQIFSGCTTGNSNLVLMRGGNFSFILTAEGALEGVMVTPLPSLLRQIREQNTPEGRSGLMSSIQSAPDSELFVTETVRDLGVLSHYPGD